MIFFKRKAFGRDFGREHYFVRSLLVLAGLVLFVRGRPGDTQKK